jgi:hypothetical protein
MVTEVPVSDAAVERMPKVLMAAAGAERLAWVV